MSEQKSVAVTLDSYKKLSRLYKNALKTGETVVQYEGQDLLVTYLKYMLQYMEMRSPEIAKHKPRKEQS